ncbi:hypothetical protein B0H10DRAFT_2228124 [Mycena sp. CBHHK59/15]|nr:hypothetical protein B0H10DRAFT_2228124 [Mycena sp. CBHHK59/15]
MNAPPIARSGDAGAAKPSCPNLHVHRPPASENDFLLLQASLEGSSARASLTSPPVIQMRGISATSLACKGFSHAPIVGQDADADPSPPFPSFTRVCYDTLPAHRLRARPPSGGAVSRPSPVPLRRPSHRAPDGKNAGIGVVFAAGGEKGWMGESAGWTSEGGEGEGRIPTQNEKRTSSTATRTLAEWSGTNASVHELAPERRCAHHPRVHVRESERYEPLLSSRSVLMCNTGGSEEVAHNDQSVVEPDTDGHSAHRCGRTKSAQDRRRVGWGSGRTGSNASPAATCTNVRVRALLRSSLDTDTTLALRVHAGARAPRCSSSSGAWAGSARVMSILGAGLADSRAPRASRLPTSAYSAQHRYLIRAQSRTSVLSVASHRTNCAPRPAVRGFGSPPRTRTVAASLRPTSHDARAASVRGEEGRPSCTGTGILLSRSTGSVRGPSRRDSPAGIPFDSVASVLAARGLRGSGRGFEERGFGEGGRRAVFLVGPAAHALVEVGYFGSPRRRLPFPSLAPVCIDEFPAHRLRARLLCDKCRDHIRAAREARDSGALWCWSTIMSDLGRRQGDVARQAKKGPVNARRWDAPGAAVRPSPVPIPYRYDFSLRHLLPPPSFFAHSTCVAHALGCPLLFGWPSTVRPAESGHAQPESGETASGETGEQNDCSLRRRDAVLFEEGRTLFSSVPAGPALMEAGSFVCQVSQESMDGGLEATGRSSPGMWFVLRGALTMLSPTRAASVGRRHLSRGSDVLHLVPTRQCWCPTLADGGVAWVVRRLLARRGGMPFRTPVNAQFTIECR